MEKMLQILVVLVPVAIFLVIGFVALEHKVRAFIKSQLQIKEQLELFRDIAVALMFVGPGAGLVFGINEQTSHAMTYIVASAAFVVFGWVAVQLSNLLRDQRLAQEAEDRQTQARTVQLLRRRGINGRKRKNRLKSR